MFPRRLIVVCRRFGTLYQFHLQGLDVKYILCYYNFLDCSSKNLSLFPRLTLSDYLIVHLTPPFKINSLLRFIRQSFSDGQKTLWCVRSASSLYQLPCEPPRIQLANGHLFVRADHRFPNCEPWCPRAPRDISNFRGKQKSRLQKVVTLSVINVRR